MRLRVVPEDEGGGPSPVWSGDMRMWLSERTALSASAALHLDEEPLETGQVGPAELIPVDPQQWDGLVEPSDRLYTAPGMARQVLQAYVVWVGRF